MFDIDLKNFNTMHTWIVLTINCNISNFWNIGSEIKA